MAQQTKTIKCPQCGSVRKTEVKPDYFRCDNCGAEYFLDNDDINFNIRHTIFNLSAKVRKWMLIIGMFILAAVLLPIVIHGLLFTHDTPESVAAPPSLLPAHPAIVETPPTRSYSTYVSTPIEINGRGYIVCFGERKDLLSEDEKIDVMSYLYDVEEDKIIHEVVFDSISKRPKNSEMHRFGDKSCYLLVDYKWLYCFNWETMQFEDYLPHIRRLHKTFSSGVADIEFAGPMKGCAFEIVSNDGAEYEYFPVLGRLYTKSDAWTAQSRMNTLLPGARDSTYYVFTETANRENSKFPQRLTEVTFKYNAGGPMRLIHTDLFYNFNNINEWPNKNDERIVSSREISPDRVWFDAHVVYMGHEDLLISVHATASDDSEVNIQKIDTHTGDVLWSTAMESDDSYSYEHRGKAIRVGDYYIIRDDSDYVVVNAKGKIIKKIKLYRLLT